MKFFDGKKKILIKTYCFESGLWYLAQSLYLELIKEGHDVKFLPKSKYVQDGLMFHRKYIEPNTPEEFKKEFMLRMTENQSIKEQVLKYIVKYDIDIIISLETLMQKSNWIQYVKVMTKVKVIDVPMIEWVSPKYLSGMSYSIFDEIWALTDFTYDKFNKLNYKNLKRIDWDYVDRGLFFNNSNRSKLEKVNFYHAGSLNPDYSSKNTDLVIQAFAKLLDDGANATLTITGKVTDKLLLNIIDKHTNIIVLNGAVTRRDIKTIYNNTVCVIAPSSKEGLGLSLYEAEACGCELITTDAPPMNSHRTKYLCEVSNMKNDGTIVPLAKLTVDNIYKQIKRVYEDKNGK
jgi:glycosyltransferase involved in cell wall biosynthesis